MSRRLDVKCGDCREVLSGMADHSVDAVVTDPPYGLSKHPDAAEVLRHWLNGDDYQHTGGGFMGKTWDSFVPGPSVWREVFRVLKPGGHMLVFSGTRTYDLTVMAIRLAGFEIRDQLAWMYGTGFPKSLDVSKAIDKSAGADREILGFKKGTTAHTDTGRRDMPGKAVGIRQMACDVPITAPATPEAQQWQGWGTALKPAQEPIVLARKPLIGTVAANVLEHGTGGLNVDGCRIACDDSPTAKRRAYGYTPNTEKARESESRGAMRDRSDPAKKAAPNPSDDVGRWPANVLLDETAAAMLDEQSGVLKSGTLKSEQYTMGGRDNDSMFAGAGAFEHRGYSADSGGASRFFYVAKASKSEREAGLDHMRKASAGELTGGRKEGSAGLDNPRAGAGRTSSGRANTHPTVKPIALMRYLVRLVTPPDGLVLDPYTGSGTTGIACALDGFNFVGIEKQPEYVEIAKSRIRHHEHTPPKQAEVKWPK